MNYLSTVTAFDWAALIIGIIGLVAARLQSKDRLPKWVRKWLTWLGQDRVEEAVRYAEAFTNMTPEARRTEAVNYLIEVADRELGLKLPTSIANLLIEYVYQLWKRRH